MLSNQQILAEIHARRSRTEAKIKELELPAQLAELLPRVAEIDPRVVKALASELIESFGYWADPKYTGGSGDEVLAAAGFEWYYDGSDPPDTIGFGYESVSPEPSMEGTTDLVTVKDDFLAGCELEDSAFEDTGGIDMNLVCGPFYELVTGEDFDTDEYEEASDLVGNLFLLHLLESLHLAAHQAAESEAFTTLQTTPHFYLVARNHDDVGFIFALMSK